MTLLDLLIELQRHGACSEEMLIAMALDRILTGRVILSGIYAAADSTEVGLLGNCRSTCGAAGHAGD